MIETKTKKPFFLELELLRNYVGINPTSFREVRAEALVQTKKGPKDLAKMPVISFGKEFGREGVVQVVQRVKKGEKSLRLDSWPSYNF